MDFHDWNAADPPAMGEVCGWIQKERERAWNAGRMNGFDAGVHQGSQIEVPAAAPDAEEHQRKDKRIHELYSENGDLKNQIRHLTEDNMELHRKIKQLIEGGPDA